MVQFEKTPLIDAFNDSCPSGAVIGTTAPNGSPRLVRDVEGQIGISDQALRLAPLITPGWGRQGIAYGPFRREAGLTLAVSITNGHNTSQGTKIPDDFVRRLWRWARGPGIDPVLSRLARWISGPRKRGAFRRFRWWYRTSGHRFNLPDFNENLALGWFPSETPHDPLRHGNAFIIHAALGDNGEVWARVGDSCLAAFRGLQNVRVFYVVVLRERGAAYYAAAAPGAYGLGSIPMLRPIGIDPFNSDEVLFAGVHQCALGQIGFRVETRVHGIHIERMSEFARRFGAAHGSDPMRGEGAFEGGHGRGTWSTVSGCLERTCLGTISRSEASMAVMNPGAASGLIHAMCAVTQERGVAGLVWRYKDQSNFFVLEITTQRSIVARMLNGVREVLAIDSGQFFSLDREHSVQVLDGFGKVSCYLDGSNCSATGSITAHQRPEPGRA
jgi:hypothetical protein